MHAVSLSIAYLPAGQGDRVGTRDGAGDKVGVDNGGGVGAGDVVGAND